MSINEEVDRSALFQALDADTSKEAVAFNELWKGVRKGDKQIELIDSYYECREWISLSGIEKCEQAVMQLKQLEHTLIRLAHPLGLASKRAAQLIVRDVVKAAADGAAKLKEIRAWGKV